MFVAEVRKSPDVSQTHSIAKTREEEVALIVPVPSVQLLLLLHVRHVLFSLALAHDDPLSRKIQIQIAWEYKSCVMEMLIRLIVIPH